MGRLVAQAFPIGDIVVRDLASFAQVEELVRDPAIFPAAERAHGAGLGGFRDVEVLDGALDHLQICEHRRIWLSKLLELMLDDALDGHANQQGDRIQRRLAQVVEWMHRLRDEAEIAVRLIL